MSIFSRAICAAALIAALGHPALADEGEDAVAAGLSACRAGTLALATEELDHASQLLGEMMAEGVSAFLPAPAPGWTRMMGDAQAVGAALFGGGIWAEASYADARGAEVIIQMVADHPMVAAVGAIFGNAAAMGAMGRMIRAGRRKAALTGDGQIQAPVANRVLAQIGGDAPEADKLACFELIDFKALGDM